MTSVALHIQLALLCLQQGVAQEKKHNAKPPTRKRPPDNQISQTGKRGRTANPEHDEDIAEQRSQFSSSPDPDTDTHTHPEVRHTGKRVGPQSPEPRPTKRHLQAAEDEVGAGSKTGWKRLPGMYGIPLSVSKAIERAAKRTGLVGALTNEFAASFPQEHRTTVLIQRIASMTPNPSTAPQKALRTVVSAFKQLETKFPGSADEIWQLLVYYMVTSDGNVLDAFNHPTAFQQDILRFAQRAFPSKDIEHANEPIRFFTITPTEGTNVESSKTHRLRNTLLQQYHDSINDSLKPPWLTLLNTVSSFLNLEAYHSNPTMMLSMTMKMLEQQKNKKSLLASEINRMWTRYEASCHSAPTHLSFLPNAFKTDKFWFEGKESWPRGSIVARRTCLLAFLVSLCVFDSQLRQQLPADTWVMACMHAALYFLPDPLQEWNPMFGATATRRALQPTIEAICSTACASQQEQPSLCRVFVSWLSVPGIERVEDLWKPASRPQSRLPSETLAGITLQAPAPVHETHAARNICIGYGSKQGVYRSPSAVAFHRCVLRNYPRTTDPMTTPMDVHVTHRSCVSMTEPASLFQQRVHEFLPAFAQRMLQLHFDNERTWQSRVKAPERWTVYCRDVMSAFSKTLRNVCKRCTKQKRLQALGFFHSAAVMMVDSSAPPQPNPQMIAKTLHTAWQAATTLFRQHKRFTLPVQSEVTPVFMKNMFGLPALLPSIGGFLATYKQLYFMVNKQSPESNKHAYTHRSLIHFILVYVLTCDATLMSRTFVSLIAAWVFRFSFQLVPRGDANDMLWQACIPYDAHTLDAFASESKTVVHSCFTHVNEQQLKAFVPTSFQHNDDMLRQCIEQIKHACISAD